MLKDFSTPFNAFFYDTGGVQCPNTGNIYGIPSDAADILKIDADTKRVSRFGDLGNGKNKWQGGVIGQDGTCL